MSEDQNQRQFSRIAFDATATVDQAERQWKVKVIDLSLKGVLIEDHPEEKVDANVPVTIAVALDGDVTITIPCHWVHSEANHSGFKCDHIDLDSISHLRRLVELNLGSEELLERELSNLG